MNSSQFDSSSDPDGPEIPFGSSPRQPRPFLGIQFRCCRTYGRIYRNNSGNAYIGNCPMCLSKVNVPIGGGGSSARFFSAG
ncbi:hypothetical protein K227x_27810 [Rubripirellula lacrimiformis]|uniref:Uncharacterized protein n=1 Tax=Rubripirellula lacrimiformis TaxID=1930273 RepID=A0A517NB92_9BACT|nr:hypothetical protein [Rubripirellula lacrimiformis]QDT04390.1 hypothetical protein K227x_27810 [Rubripirellula lacrimiformis]